ncbi:MAG TPA: ATP-binding protein [Polyangia bacterium]|nr:ATP-binding protein [Polyangia bacterium]
MTSGEKAHQRLESLYEISKLFARFENVEQPFDPALGIVAKTLPLRSAILVEKGEDRSKMIVWSAAGQNDGHLQPVKEHVGAAYAYLVGARSIESLNLEEQTGMTVLPAQDDVRVNLANRFIVIPLVVAQRRPFGVLQFEGAEPLDKTDLIFVNAIANQLAIALDRDRAWRRDIIRRQRAEEEQSHAEQKGVVAERERVSAESNSHKYQVLAAENSRLYQEAQQAVRAREQILAVVSHDLRNPLGAVLMTAEALVAKGDVPLPAARIKRSAERMLRLIEDLLDFASIEAGHLSIRRTSQDPGWLIRETVTTFEGVVQGKGQRLTVEIAPALPMAFCDRDRILQVLSNLVGNATKAASKGGHIVLTVKVHEQELLFTVADDGPGISEEDGQHLFERYWRSDQVAYEGAGLGLAIAKGIVNAHRGRIWADSTLGRGATFFFTIPMPDVALA